jgi:hypothetical protein
MALQSDNLVMIGRGILNDQPVNHSQPILRNGIHLRYAFARERGFPWYGYYLFRRLRRDSKPICVLPPQNRGALEPNAFFWRCPQGVFYSDGPLKLGDAFAPARQLEFDLRATKACCFILPPGQFARQFSVKIGLYRSQPSGTNPPAESPPNVARSARKAGKAPSTKPRPPPFVQPIEVVAFAYHGTSPVAQTAISGRPGQIVTVVLTADLMDGIFIFSNSCALIEVCFVPSLTDNRAGWGQLRDFPYPLCLPNSQPAYPCVGKPANSAQALVMAKSRVRYGDLAIWDDGRFAEMTSMLDDLLIGGPSVGAMDARVTSDSVPGGTGDDPHMPSLSPLDMLLFASLQPAVAQVLGLYWVDQTATNNATYDYAILADHDNSFKGSVKLALAALTSGNLPANVDGWICFNLKKGPAPAFAAPAGPLCYALPGGVVASSEQNAVAPVGTNTVGLRWTLPTTPDNGLLADGAIFYHLWRADLAAAAPTAAPPEPAYTLLTADAPIIVADVDVPANTTPLNASDWPPFRLFAYDRRLADGWYSYRLAGVDIFGQYSALSDPAQWYQWAPPPAPLPWYYVGAGSDAELNAYAVHVRDTTPPPAPPGVEAYALDPLDPMLIRDTAFAAWLGEGWWNALTAAQQSGQIGLRVTWRWTRQQMLQAPDTKEFRIYFNPTGDPPAPDSGVSTNWSARIFVVAYGDQMSADTFGDQTYDVLLPLVHDTRFTGVPLAPDNANPVAYGQVGVSAADDRIETADNAKWPITPFGNRTGNEGRVGVPAKIYRVLRAPPPPPGIADANDKVWATPANYHGLSYYTFRWPKPPTDSTLIDAHIFQAMDEKLFEYDFRRRPRQPLDANNANLFPVASWNATTRTNIKAELDALNALTPIVAGDSDATVTARIRAALPAYRTLSDNALRTLASLPADAASAPKPGNDGAFSQITYQPLKHTDAANFDRIGPDGADSYVPDANLCAYLAELDGRAQNRYFFRVAFVNRAHDTGAVGPASPPVYLPKVEPPRTPAITKILGGERQVTLQWAANREADLAEYRIYRADNARSARDIRVMTLVGTVAETQPDPALRAKELTWTDTGVIGLKPYHYRMTSRDSAQNESAPTSDSICSAFDVTPPSPPIWIAGQWVDQSGTLVVSLSWHPVETGTDVMVQRKESNPTALWSDISQWLDDSQSSWVDTGARPYLGYTYRLRGRSAAGNTNVTWSELNVASFF